MTGARATTSPRTHTLMVEFGHLASGRDVDTPEDL